MLELAPTTNYKFNVDGTDAIGGNDATLNNGAAIVTDSERGNVLETDGVDDYASIPATVTNGNFEFSFSFWVKTTESGTHANYYERPTLFGMRTGAAGSGDLSITTNNGFIGMWTGLPAVNDVYLSGTTQINDDQWHMITVANDGSNAVLYVDGVFEASVNTGNSLDNYGYHIGGSNYEGTPSYQHSGRFDDVRIYDHGLTPDDITDLYALTDTDTVTITVDPAPVVNNQVFAVDENSLVLTSVDTVIATDNGSVANYQITAGNTGNAFAINAGTGEITVATSAMLDHETTPIFNLTVEVTDNLGLTDSATITIDVDDLDESPIFGGDDTGAVTEDVGVVANMITDHGQPDDYRSGRGRVQLPGRDG